MITEKAIVAQTDAVWHSLARPAFLARIKETVADEGIHDLYLLVIKNKRDSDKVGTFVRKLEKGQFVGTVVYHALRTHFGH